MPMTPQERKVRWRAKRSALRSALAASPAVPCPVTAVTPVPLVPPAVPAVTLETGGSMPLAPVTPPPAPVRERDPKTGRFPATPPPCPPATTAQLERAVALMRSGELTRTVLSRSGLTCWESLNEGALVAYGPDAWHGIVKAWHDARVLRIVDRAQAVVEREEPAVEGGQTGPAGTVSSYQRRTDAAMIQQALAGLLPNVHGKLASGKATTAVQVNISLAEAVEEVERTLAASKEKTIPAPPH